MAVGGVARVGQQPFVARIGGDGEGKHQSARGARCDDDALGGDVGAKAVVIETGDGFAQRAEAECRRVMHVAAGEEVAGRFDDGGRRREVRLADLQVDDVASGGRQLVGALEDFHHVEGLDVGHPAGDLVHGVSLRKNKKRRLPGAFLGASAAFRLPPTYTDIASSNSSRLSMN